jgi:4-azaleucine resistance transporter AzlC
VKTRNEKTTGGWEGLLAGLPVALGYLPTAVAFGLMARSLQIPSLIACLMSVLIFAGAAQFMGIQMLAAGASAPQVILATFLLNLRHLLMSASLSQKLENGIAAGGRAAISFGVTDETFAVATLRTGGGKLSPSFLLGLNTVAYAAWVGGTTIGVLLGQKLAVTVQESLAISLYAMFIALLVPNIRKSSRFLVIALVAIIINSGLRWSPWFNLSSGWSLVIAITAAAALGAVLYPQGVDS